MWILCAYTFAVNIDYTCINPHLDIFLLRKEQILAIDFFDCSMMICIQCYLFTLCMIVGYSFYIVKPTKKQEKEMVLPRPLMNGICYYYHKDFFQCMLLFFVGIETNKFCNLIIHFIRLVWVINFHNKLRYVCWYC